MALGHDQQSNPGWASDLWKFWRGHKSAGPGPSIVPGAMSPTGGDVTAGAPASVSSVDTQTYPFSIQAAAAPTLIVNRQPTRASLTISNNGLSTLFVFFGPNSVNLTNTALALQVPAGTQYQPRVGVPVDEIYLFSSGGTFGVIITGT